MDNTNIKDLEKQGRKAQEARQKWLQDRALQSAKLRGENAKRYETVAIYEARPPSPEIRPKLEFKAKVEFSRPVDGNRHEVLVMHADVAGYTAEECFENLVAQFKNGLIAFPKFDHTFKVKDGKIKATSHPRELSEPGHLIQGEEMPRSRTLKFWGK
jgi:hypothetical protein